MNQEQSEKILHRKVCDYLQEYYPHVYFDSDSSGIRVGQGMANQLKQTRSSHAHLDLTVLEPSREFKALILELKVKTPFLKDGSLSTEAHIQDQFITMCLLESKGYKCMWCWSLDQAITIFQNYLGDPKQDNTPLFP